MKRAMLPLLALAGLAVASAAAAHPHVKTATPAPSAILPTSPHQVRIDFTEGLVAQFSGLELTGPGGAKVDTAPVKIDPPEKNALAVAVQKPLAPGTYTVSWHVVGDDTHKVAGRYTFDVKP